jgi:hypothetical protein
MAAAINTVAAMSIPLGLRGYKRFVWLVADMAPSLSFEMGREHDMVGPGRRSPWHIPAMNQT